MPTERRPLLGAVAGVLVAGCTTTGPGESTEDADPTDTGGSTDDGTPTRPDDTPGCDPADVTWPAVATGTDIEGKSYPRKPTELTDDSVAAYVDEFEAAFAWNRALENGDVTSLNVETLAAFDADETGDGYLASGEIGVTFTTEDGDETGREYVANYFVAPGPVFRTESDSDPVTPRTEEEETLLVQCGPETDAA